MKKLIVILLASLLVFNAWATSRDPAQKAAFRRAYACPATGAVKGKCVGYEVDHIIPLCADGADHPSNMQWLTVKQHKAKTKREHAMRVCKRRAR